MADTKEIVENFRVTARHFQNVLDMVEVLDRVGDAERAAAEAKLKLQQTQAALVEAEEQLEDTKATCKQVRSAAKTAAAQLVADAQAKAETVIAEAEATKAEALAEAEAAKAKAQVVRNSALAALNEAEAHKAQLETEAMDLELRIERARSKMAEILGG